MIERLEWEKYFPTNYTVRILGGAHVNPDEVFHLADEMVAGAGVRSCGNDMVFHVYDDADVQKMKNIGEIYVGGRCFQVAGATNRKVWQKPTHETVHVLVSGIPIIATYDAVKKIFCSVSPVVHLEFIEAASQERFRLSKRAVVEFQTSLGASKLVNAQIYIRHYPVLVEWLYSTDTPSPTARDHLLSVESTTHNNLDVPAAGRVDELGQEQEVFTDEEQGEPSDSYA